MFGGLPTQHRSKQNHQTLQQHSPTTYPRPLNINDLMRADCLALCLRCFANRVTDRERYIAPQTEHPTSSAQGGWAFISGGVEVLPGMRWRVKKGSSLLLAFSQLCSMKFDYVQTITHRIFRSLVSCYESKQQRASAYLWQCRKMTTSVPPVCC